MKNILILLLFLTIGCDLKYKSNYQINIRRTPIVVIALDTTKHSVVMRDGDNKVFTLFDNPTTLAITNSLQVGDTIRPNILIKYSSVKKF